MLAPHLTAEAWLALLETMPKAERLKAYQQIEEATKALDGPEIYATSFTNEGMLRTDRDNSPFAKLRQLWSGTQARFDEATSMAREFATVARAELEKSSRRSRPEDKERNDKIRANHKNRLTPGQIAKKMQLTVKQVRGVLNRSKSKKST